MLLINSEKGRDIFMKCAKSIWIGPIDIADVMQPRLSESEKKSQTYSLFWIDYLEMDFPDFIKKYSKNNYNRVELIKKRIIKLLRIPFKLMKHVFCFIK